MTLAAVGLLQWPIQQFQANVGSSGLSVSTLTFDSTADRVAYVAKAYQADSISKVFFRTNTVTTGDTVKIEIQSVTNGRPSGTIIAAGASGTVAIADTDDNRWLSVTIGTPYTFSIGEDFAIVLTHDSGATPNLQLAIASGEITGWVGGLYPSTLQDTGGGSWSALAGTKLEWVVEMTTAAGAVTFPGLIPLNGAGTITAFNSGTNPNERALKLVAPAKMRVIGLSLALFNNAAGSDVTFSIWDSTDNPGAAPSALAQTSLDGDYPYSATADGVVHVFFAAPLTLTAGSTYYIGVKPTTANNIGLMELSAAGTGASSTGIRAFGIGTVTAHLSTRQWVSTDPGAWTDTTTTLPAISLIVDQIDDGASAGGGGGMRMAGHGGLAA